MIGPSRSPNAVSGPKPQRCCAGSPILVALGISGAEVTREIVLEREGRKSPSDSSSPLQRSLRCSAPRL